MHSQLNIPFVQSPRYLLLNGESVNVPAISRQRKNREIEDAKMKQSYRWLVLIDSHPVIFHGHFRFPDSLASLLIDLQLDCIDRDLLWRWKEDWIRQDHLIGTSSRTNCISRERRLKKTSTDLSSIHRHRLSWSITKEISIEMRRHLLTKEFLVLLCLEKRYRWKSAPFHTARSKTTNRSSALVVQLEYFLIGYNEWWQIELRCCVQYDHCVAVMRRYVANYRLRVVTP